MTLATGGPVGGGAGFMAGGGPVGGGPEGGGPEGGGPYAILLGWYVWEATGFIGGGAMPGWLYPCRLVGGIPGPEL